MSLSYGRLIGEKPKRRRNGLTSVIAGSLLLQRNEALNGVTEVRSFESVVPRYG